MMRPSPNSFQSPLERKMQDVDSDTEMEMEVCNAEPTLGAKSCKLHSSSSPCFVTSTFNYVV
jgi:hypothetical protein